MQTKPPQQITVTQAMDIAVAHHREGRVRDAEGIYRQILANYPDFAPAVHMLGVVVFQSGKRDEGLALVRKALNLQPNYAEACANLGHLLREVGQIDEAIAACRRAI